ncbi:unnamed protein product [Tilletia controversa]|nr:unnamed protein product [Tilletia controversa]CAD6916273.1 unnamed protein product [Tilletia controversa]
MSAYGAIDRTGPTSTGVCLPSSLWPTRNPVIKLSIQQIPDLATIQALPLDSKGGTLLEHLRSTIASTVEDGRVYPQEDASEFRGEGKAFETYFFVASDVFVGVLEDADALPALGAEIEGTEARLIEAGGVTAPGALLEAARKGRTWKEAVVGCYYIKPNYPGRSSHICNGDFVVSPSQRGLSLGTTLGNSYVFYATALGFKASVFNLVYANNLASVRIWDRLGFTRAAVIPKAGRLRCEGERGRRGEEEYVDAIVFYKSFE